MNYIEVLSLCTGLLFWGYYYYQWKKPRVRLISIDGNIGAGKTTFLRTLFHTSSIPNLIYITNANEPVNEWISLQDEDNNNILTYFYENPKRWAYTFQNYIFLTRCQAIEQAREKLLRSFQWWNPFQSRDWIILTERSPYSDLYVFIEMLYEQDKSISSLEYKLYQSWFQSWISNITLDGIIYLTCSPERCQQRIKQRNRKGEENISLDYLTRLHHQHESWMKTMRSMGGRPHILELDEQTPWSDETLIHFLQTT